MKGTFHYEHGPDPYCDRCNGEVLFFKEGWACAKCDAGGDWGADGEALPWPSRSDSA